MSILKIGNACLLCNDIEDEFHFVMCCQKTYYLRTKYLPKSLFTKPSMFKFIQFICSEDLNNIKKFGIFLHYAFKKYIEEDVFL